MLRGGGDTAILQRCRTTCLLPSTTTANAVSLRQRTGCLVQPQDPRRCKARCTGHVFALWFIVAGVKKWVSLRISLCCRAATASLSTPKRARSFRGASPPSTCGAKSRWTGAWRLGPLSSSLIASPPQTSKLGRPVVVDSTGIVCYGKP